MDPVFDPRVEVPPSPARPELPPRRRSRAGLGIGLALGVGAGLVAGWFLTPLTGASARPEPLATAGPPTPAPGAAEAEEVAESPDALNRRWQRLQAAFLEVAAPLGEALDRAERARRDLPARQAVAREAVRLAKAAHVAAKQRREDAESDEDSYNRYASPGEDQYEQGDVATAEAFVARAQARFDDLHRAKQRVADAWVAKGTPRASADSAAALLFKKDLLTQESMLRNAQFALSRAKSDHARAAAYERPRKAKQLRAIVEARREEERARKEALDRAKDELSRLEASPEHLKLSPGEAQLLDRLVEALRGAGSRPPRGGDPAEFTAFLDRFEAGLDAAREATRDLPGAGPSVRYNAVVNRLLRAEDEARTD